MFSLGFPRFGRPEALREGVAKTRTRHGRPGKWFALGGYTLTSYAGSIRRSPAEGVAVVGAA